MKFRRFLKYERSYLLFLAFCFLVMFAVFYLDGDLTLQGGAAGYALLLLLLLTAGFVVYRYTRNVQAIRSMHREDSEPLSLEAEACQLAMDDMRRDHIRALNEVQAKQDEYYDFIVSWFHEIKIPISVLRLMQQTGIDPKSLDEEVSRIEHYVDQALYYAKLDNFNQDYEIVNCNLEQIVKEVVRSHSKSFISRKIRISLAIEPTVVQSDSKWLQFIIHQLVSNSLKYTDNSGEVVISSRTTPQEKLLIVRDDGIGIDGKDLPRIFNRGFTGTNGRLHVKSTGMGLYLAQELSRKLGHYMTCESEAGRYTEMTVHFPRNSDAYLDTLRETIL